MVFSSASSCCKSRPAPGFCLVSLKNGVGLPTYDVFGNRLSETVTQNGTTTTTLFSYDANNTLYATENSSGTITTRYISGVGGPDLWLAQVDATGGNNSAWLLSDYQGTVTSVVSMSNGSYTQLTYDPYGNVRTRVTSWRADCHHVEQCSWGGHPGLPGWHDRSLHGLCQVRGEGL